MTSSLSLARRLSTFAAKPLRIATCAVKPPSQPRQRFQLTPSDLTMTSLNYIQRGLLFPKTHSSVTTDITVDTLKTSLSTALHHFRPLSGRLVVEKPLDNKGEVTGMSIHVDCNGQGAEFVHAVAENVTVDDVLSPGNDVPDFVQSLFTLDGAINYDGHVEPLLSVQFTELVDGFFVGCSFNHMVGDGKAFWNFFNAWGEIARNGGDSTPLQAPSLERPLDGVVAPIKLPFKHADEFIERPIIRTSTTYRERIFHFSPESIAKLKATANRECKTKTGSPISSLQSVAALIWRSITRARNLPDHHTTHNIFLVDHRAHLKPPLSPNYFGNMINIVLAATTAGELLSSSLGHSAALIHEAVTSPNQASIHNAAAWMESPLIYRGSMFPEGSVTFAGSPRFEVFGCDFGWGEAVAMRGGRANKVGGMVMSYPGREGGGSMDLEICLPSECMERLVADEELMRVATC